MISEMYEVLYLVSLVAKAAERLPRMEFLDVERQVLTDVQRSSSAAFDLPSSLSFDLLKKCGDVRSLVLSSFRK